MSHLPRYPVYIPTKGRAGQPLTARMFTAGGVPFHLVVEEPEVEAYTALFGPDHVLVLPFKDAGTSVPARNWIRDHAEKAGYERHWQFDDNIDGIERAYKRLRILVEPGVALAVCEDFTDRYTNIAISGFNYSMFAPIETQKVTPFYLNCHVYSAVLINHAMPYRWRGRYNEDTDLCLQALAGGWCTVALNAFLVRKRPTMSMKGGNTADLYRGDGRAKMARSLERNWPGVVETARRFQRPQHVIKNNWKSFDTPLIRRADTVIPDEPNEYGMRLIALRDIKSPHLLRYWKGEQK